MKHLFRLLLAMILFSTAATAQKTSIAVPGKSGILYFGFGTNLSYYSKSTIHFVNNNPGGFDFTLQRVGAKDDRGVDFGGQGAAQYSYQAGYYSLKKHFGIEFNFDHIKYFVRNNQVVHLKGTINNQYYDKDTTITPAFIQFEHSDGGNYAILNFVKWKNLYTATDKRNSLDLVLKAGAGPVIPKTNSTLFGSKHRDDAYKVSGYVVALEGGIRYNFRKNLYVIPSVKGAFANYSHFVIADGYGDQRWGALHFNLLVGTQFGL